MKRITLSKGVVKIIHAAVNKLFDRAITRFTGRPIGDKRIYIGPTRVSLSSLFQAASAEEHARTDMDMLDGLIRIATGYMEAQREAAKSKVHKAVEGWLNEAHAKGVKTDVKTVLGGELAELWGKTTEAVHRIVDTEASNARNMGTLNGVVRVNAAMGINDPIVYFVVVRDNILCEECKRLHLQADGVTPRLWYMSELSHGYHKKGDDAPAVGGLHPHCRCSLVTLMPGYGFEDGAVSYIKPDHDEMAAQRGTKKHESWWGEILSKSSPAGKKHYYENVDRYNVNGERLNHGDHAFDWMDFFDQHHDFPPELGEPGQDDDVYDKRYAHMEDQMRNAPVTINLPAKRLGELNQAGRFRNVFETGHSKGSGSDDPEEGGYNDTRRNAETDHFSIPIEAGPEERPIYGAVNTHWIRPTHHTGGARGYGDAYVVLKPHVKDRTTFTLGDTFHEQSEGTAVPAEHLPKLFTNTEIRRSGGSYNAHQPYIEAQVHGGVSLPEDVESLHLTPIANPGHIPAAIELGKRHGIPVYHHTEEDARAPTLLHDPTAEAAARAAPPQPLVLTPPSPSPVKRAVARSRASSARKPRTKTPSP